MVLQNAALPAGWQRDARGAAEPLLDAWVGRLLGKPADWTFGALLKAGDGTTTVLTPVSLADLGLGPLSVALASQRAGQDRPSELEQRIGLAFAAQVPADATAELELVADAPAASSTGGLALLSMLGDWVAKLTASSPLTAGDFVSGASVGPGMTSPGTVDVAELGARVTATQTRLTSVVSALRTATTKPQRTKALLDAVAFDGPDAMPRVPANHPSAAAELTAQAEEVAARLVALRTAVVHRRGRTPARRGRAGGGSAHRTPEDVARLGAARAAEVDAVGARAGDCLARGPEGAARRRPDRAGRLAPAGRRWCARSSTRWRGC